MIDQPGPFHPLSSFNIDTYIYFYFCVFFSFKFSFPFLHFQLVSVGADLALWEDQNLAVCCVLIPHFISLIFFFCDFYLD